MEGESNNTLGVQRLILDPSGTELHWSELRTEVKPGCCNPKHGGYFSVKAAHEKAFRLNSCH